MTLQPRTAYLPQVCCLVIATGLLIIGCQQEYPRPFAGLTVKELGDSATISRTEDGRHVILVSHANFAPAVKDSVGGIEFVYGLSNGHVICVNCSQSNVKVSEICTIGKSTLEEISAATGNEVYSFPGFANFVHIGGGWFAACQGNNGNECIVQFVFQRETGKVNSRTVR